LKLSSYHPFVKHPFLICNQFKEGIFYKIDHLGNMKCKEQ